MPSGDHAGERSAERARVGDVANVALLGGDGEDLAARLGEHAPASGRERDVGHAGRDVLPARHHPREVAGRRESTAGPTRPLFGSSSCTSPACSKTSVPPPASSALTSKSVNLVCCVRRFAFASYDQTLAMPLAIGDEVDALADPHRIGVLRIRRKAGSPGRTILRSTIQIGFVLAAACSCGAPRPMSCSCDRRGGGRLARSCPDRRAESAWARRVHRRPAPSRIAAPRWAPRWRGLRQTSRARRHASSPARYPRSDATSAASAHRHLRARHTHRCSRHIPH